MKRKEDCAEVPREVCKEVPVYKDRFEIKTRCRSDGFFCWVAYELNSILLKMWKLTTNSYSDSDAKRGHRWRRCRNRDASRNVIRHKNAFAEGSVKLSGEAMLDIGF